MKIAGAVVFMAAFLFAGVCGVREITARIQTLRDLCSALEIMQGEIALRQSSIPEQCQYLKINGFGAAKNLFSTLSDMLPLLGENPFSSLWERAVLNCCKSLNATELDAMKRLGAVLGRYDTDTQMRELRACEAVLENSRNAAEHSFPSQRKLWLGLSASFGALIAVLLI